MRTVVFVLLLSTASVLAGRNNLKPWDFEPLTCLPWEKPNATFDGTLETIYREPNPDIRYPVLSEYLRTVPEDQLGRAFDKCMTLECAQEPSDLVAFFLEIWAQRDPRTCWKRTKDLFHLVGFEEGWLCYKAKKQRPKIKVQDASALQTSRFWLNSHALLSFPLGVDASSLPKTEKLEILREFAEKWFDRFGYWPGYDRPQGPCEYSGAYSTYFINIKDVFSMGIDQVRSYVTEIRRSYEQPAVEIALRRWLQAAPASAPEIIRKAQEVKWETSHGEPNLQSVGPSIELLMLWAKIDQSGMVRWAESLDIKKDSIAVTAKGLLMSRVAAGTRERWLAQAKAATTDNDDLTDNLISAWAGWDPLPALAAAVGTKNSGIIDNAGFGAAIGPFDLRPWNGCGFGLEALKKFDAGSLTPELRHDTAYNWQDVMTQWGGIDVGEAARYGLDFIVRTHYDDRNLLLRYLRGEEVHLGDDGMNDRTVCALRVWAVFHPKEMAAWIETLNDVEMRKSLTWLMKHARGPWPSN